MGRQKYKNLEISIGKQYEKWTVVDDKAPPSNGGKRRVLCRCICGKERPVLLCDLERGISKSCGCSSSLHLQKAWDASRDKAFKRGTPHCDCKGVRVSGYRLCQKCNDLWRKYNLTIDELNKTIELQAGLCTICTKEMKPGRDTHIDHDHKTNHIRGILCRECNIILGMIKDDATILIDAATYLINKGASNYYNSVASSLR